MLFRANVNDAAPVSLRYVRKGCNKSLKPKNNRNDLFGFVNVIGFCIKNVKPTVPICKLITIMYNGCILINIFAVFNNKSVSAFENHFLYLGECQSTEQGCQSGEPESLNISEFERII